MKDTQISETDGLIKEEIGGKRLVNTDTGWTKKLTHLLTMENPIGISIMKDR